MTEQQAREEIPDIDYFCYEVCTKGCGHEDYCPSECQTLQKARELDFDRIIKSYARNDGDLNKVCRYIKNQKGGQR